MITIVILTILMFLAMMVAKGMTFALSYFFLVMFLIFAAASFVVAFDIIRQEWS